MPPKKTAASASAAPAAAASAAAAPAAQDVPAAAQDVPVVPVPAPVPAEEVAAAPSSAPAITQDALAAKLTALASAHRELGILIKELFPLVKSCQKDLAQALKEKRPRRAVGGKAGEGADAATIVRKPSGFAKPTLLSAKLCEFLEVPENTTMARMEVTKLITKYVKTNKLFDEADKRTIKPDAKLTELLDVSGKPDIVVTYFNLQSLIKQHFIKTDAPAAPAAPATVSA